MPFSRARYITLCQQSLVTATVLVVGLSAAGVKTLDIVPAPAPLTDAQGAVPVVPGAALGYKPAPKTPKTPKASVDTAPVTPKVREVKVAARQAPKPATGSDRSATTEGSATPSTPARTPQRVLVDHKPLVALSAPQKVTGFATIGVTWKHGVKLAEDAVGVQVRTQKAGRWSVWTTVQYHDDHGPDGDPGELTAHARPGTDALVVGDVDQVQMRAENASGAPIPDLQLAVIDPGTGTMVEQHPAIDTAKLATTGSATTATNASATTTSSSTGSTDSIALSAMKISPKPQIFSRAQWGANEKIRDQSAPSYGTVKAGFIHHTVNANNYTAAQVPALLRGIYAYHVESRGWRDIGYNYLVDRFGRIWEGRYGGVDRAVIGAHTKGYNEVSFAMSAIGNYDIAEPPAAVLNAYARLFAWKLSLYNIRADATHVYVKNRYLNAINGHRDVGQTACPGKYLYAKIPAIRALAQKYQNAAQTGTTVPVTPTAPTVPADPTQMTSPTQAPRAATAQPSSIGFPHSLNLTGDARPDLVLGRSDGTVSVLPTGGQTGFRTPVATGVNWRANTMVTAVGDVTGDSRGDVLVRARNGVSGIYAGDGYGHVRGHALGLTKRFRYADLVMDAGDWNHDGRGDVLMRDHKTGYLYLVRGKGAGRFGKATLLSRSFRSFTSVTVTGDLTGDGRPDVVGLHRNHYLYLARATKKGKLAKLVRRGRLASSITTIMGGTRDLTGDSYGDLVVRTRAGSVSLLPGRRYAWFGRPYGPFPTTAPLGRISLAPMSAGSAPDLVGVGSNGALLVSSQNGLTNLRPIPASNLRQAGIVQVLNVGDWNGDGRGDVITRQSGGNSLVLRPGLGNGQFGRPVVMSTGWTPFTRLAAVGDVTGDQHPDLVGRSATGITTIFPGNGRTGFLAPVRAANFVRTFNQIGTGLWKPQDFGAATFLSAGFGFVPFVGTGAGPLAGYTWVVGPGDVDGDGRSDLVARDASGALWLLPGTASGYASRRLIGEGFAGYTLGG